MGHIKRTHVYKQSERFSLKLDVYLPESVEKRLPVVIYVHGGALIWGSREGINENEMNAVVGEGMAYVAIDYRLAPETKLMDIRADVEDALHWVREEGARLYGFDPGRVAMLGKSAGGYLALLSGTFPNRPNAIVSFYGYGDILGDWYSRPSPHYAKRPPVSEHEADKCLTAGTPTCTGHQERWALYLRARQTGLWASLVSGYDPNEISTALKPYCPILMIDAHYPPTFLLHGSADTDVPVERSMDMYGALTQMGIKTRLYIQPNAEHGFDAAWSILPEEFGRVIRFLKDTL